MKYNIPSTAILLLQDGTIFYGKSAGVKGTATGEICFNTAMTGYQETFTDPSYYGQILVTTNAHIGNYGVKSDEQESVGVKISALICKNFSIKHSRQKSISNLGNFFSESNKIIVSDIDTRALVRHIRSKGAMNAIVSTEISDPEQLMKELMKVPSMEGLELSSYVTSHKSTEHGNPNSLKKVALIDLGLKTNIIKNLIERGCFVKVFPMNTSFEEMDSWQPSGYLLSNGPGDPETLTEVIKTVKKILDSDKKIFGICLGHQVIALSLGLKTFKMYNGHRGINHPILNTITGKGEITTQNHGFVIDENSLKNNENVAITHRHLNDNTIAGIKLKNRPVFSVQYHPEAGPGPNDSKYLFDQFVNSLCTEQVSI